jgi:predicted ATP-binding protein involved in virulence
MNIKNVQLHNYKGFKDIEVNFHPKLNLLIGSNASGKTTLLTAMLKGIANITKRFARERTSRFQVSASDINYNETECFIKICIENFPEYSKILTSVVGKIPPNSLSTDLRQAKTELEEFIKWYQQQVSISPATVPIFKFYPANRGSISYSDQSRNDTYTISQLETWSNIYQDAISYSKFFEWFFENETNELRLQRDAQDFNIESNELKGVRNALKIAFRLLGYGEVKIKTKQIQRVNSSKLTPTLIIENIHRGMTDEIDNKSDGEKAIITLIADIAYNLSLAKDFTFDDEFLNSPGIVLIDEIESHLHPNWQREIIPILTTLFPNVQFFIASHSPQVVSAVKSESIFLCDNFLVEPIRLKTKGEDTNTLLRYIFNSTERPKEYNCLSAYCRFWYINNSCIIKSYLPGVNRSYCHTHQSYNYIHGFKIIKVDRTDFRRCRAYCSQEIFRCNFDSNCSESICRKCTGID